MSRLAFAFCLLLPTCFGQSDPLLDVLKSELDRNFAVLKDKAEPPAYFLSYSIVEQKAAVLSATLGTLQSRNAGASRILDVSIRVGAPKLDNYHTARGERPQFTVAALLPIEMADNAIRRRLWLETDRTLRAASQRLINLRTSTQVNVAEEDQSDDFSREEPSVFLEDRVRKQFSIDDWAPAARKWSAQLGKVPGALSSNVSVRLQDETKYYVSSEGSRLRHGRGFARITLVAQGKAPDGMDLVTTASFDGESADGLPKDAQVMAAVEQVGKDLEGLLKAPLVEPFVGPAILSGAAAGVFFHEIFGHRVEGHRQRDESDGQTFTKSVNTKVLPEFLSVIFDPTRKSIGGIDLNGSYDYDDEGIKGRPVTVVENGVLKTFLMSRKPIRGFVRSNGHGRKQAGAEAVSRQSNLIVESAKKVTDEALRGMLIAEIKRQGKPYGFYFQQVTGGFTNTGRSGFQSFKVLPLVVYRVYPDGRPDELVRGVDIVGTPLASFSRIVATSDRQEVFNGYCGAESGSVPVSAVSPAILVSELEIQKKDQGRDRPPLLQPPSGGSE